MRILRFIAPLLFGIALLAHQSSQGMWADLFLFNAIPITCLLSIMVAPRINNKWAKPLTALAIGIWSLGSILATASSYIELPAFAANISDALYLLFYPLALLGMQFLISIRQRLTILELVDASIVGLGLSTLGAAFALQPVIPHFDGDLNQSFLAIIYPVADLVLLCFIIATVVMQGFSIRDCF
jgi:hypothetical protein